VELMLEIKIKELLFNFRPEKFDEDFLKDIILDNIYRLPKNIGVAVDIGANIGGLSLLVAKNCGCVYAFEPENSNFDILLKNVKKNKLEKNVLCFNEAVGDGGERKLFLNSESSGSHTFFVEKEEIHKAGYSGDYQLVKTKTLKQIFDENKIDVCDFLKIDCEGAEYEIIYQIDDSLAKRIKMIAMELHPGDQFEVIKHLRKYFRVKVIDTNPKGNLLVYCYEK